MTEAAPASLLISSRSPVTPRKVGSKYATYSRRRSAWVSRRIHGDEIVVGDEIGCVLLERLLQIRELDHRRGTDVRTICVAEIQERPCTFEAIVRERCAGAPSSSAKDGISRGCWSRYPPISGGGVGTGCSLFQAAKPPDNAAAASATTAVPLRIVVGVLTAVPAERRGWVSRQSVRRTARRRASLRSCDPARMRPRCP